VCLIARHFESKGIPTLILGSGMDIMQAGKPPRAQFLNYPLGFEAGKPFDESNQLDILGTALTAFERMKSPGIETMDFSWDEGWQMIHDRNSQSTGTDQRSPRDTEPRYQTELDRELAEGNASNQGAN